MLKIAQSELYCVFIIPRLIPQAAVAFGQAQEKERPVITASALAD